MCVIIYKPAGVEIPTKTELSQAHLCHPHGIGFVSPSFNYKGFSFNQFIKKLKKVPVNEPCIIHFRYATHGSVKKSNCHPFKEGDVWFAHNGILHIEPLRDLTDSETAFRYIIYPYIEKYGLKSAKTINVINSIIGYSKFAFMQGEEVTLFGNFVELGGLYYSNLRHLY